jgi:hypothetical protein
MDEHSYEWTPWCWHPWHIFPTSITFDRFDFFSNLVFYQSFENFKLVKHTKFNLHGIKKCLLRKIINESFLNIFPFHEILLWDHIGLCAQAQEFLFHENPTQWKWGMVVFTIHTSIEKLRSWSPSKWCFQQGYFCAWLLKLT